MITRRKIRKGRLMIVTGGPHAGRRVRVVGASAVETGAWNVEPVTGFGWFRVIAERLMIA